MTRGEYERARLEYYNAMKPIQDSMVKVIELAIPVLVLTTEGKLINRKWDEKTQEGIDNLNKLMQDVTDHYKTKYPELFRF